MLTASVVLYNTDILLLKEVVKSYAPSKEKLLYLIDNSPTPNNEYIMFENMEGVTYVFNNANIGYGAAHNIAIKESIKLNSDDHLVLNPDIKFETEILDSLIEYADKNKDVVYILPKVIYPNGELQYLCKLLPSPFDLIFRRFLPSVGPIKRINDRYTLKSFGYDKIINPPCLSGCFMFMRMETLKKYDLKFDDRFFMYCEDFDLIRRLHRVGKTIYYPYVSIIHNHAKESYKSKKMLITHIASAIKYFNKYGWFFDNERKMMNRRVINDEKI